MPKAVKPPEDELGSVSLGELNSRIRDMAAGALEQAGGMQYLLQVARKNPNAFLRLISQFIQNDTAVNAAGLNIIVQQINIGTAGPVPGVLASPITAHIAHTPEPLQRGEIIDMPGGTHGA